MPIQQKLPPPVLLFSDFAGWVRIALTSSERYFYVSQDSSVLPPLSREKTNWEEMKRTAHSNTHFSQEFQRLDL